MIEVTSRHMECTFLTPEYSQMPAVALQWETEKRNPSLNLFFFRAVQRLTQASLDSDGDFKISRTPLPYSFCYKLAGFDGVSRQGPIMILLPTAVITMQW